MIPPDSRPPGRALVLFDGGCPFCRRCVEWAKARDRGQRLEFVPFDGCPSPPMTPELRAACERSLHVILPDGRTERGGRAVLFVMADLGWPMSWLRHRPFACPVEAGYWLVARSRPLLSRLIHD